MHRYLLPASITALALAVLVYSIAPASAAYDKGVLQCVPTSLFEKNVKSEIQYAAVVTTHLRKAVEAGRKDFMRLESSKGNEIICMW